MGVQDSLWGSGMALSWQQQGGEAASLLLRCEQGVDQARLCSGAALVGPAGEGQGGATTDPAGLESSADPHARQLPDPGPALAPGGVVAVVIHCLLSWWPPSVRWGITGFSDNPGLIPQP